MNMHAATFLRVLSQLARDLGVEVPVKVLVVERDDNCFRVARDMLSAAPFKLEVKRAKSVEAAKNLLSREYVDVCAVFTHHAKACAKLGVPIIVIKNQYETSSVPLACQLETPRANPRYVGSAVRNAVTQTCSTT
jgi:hypothetical protein